MGYLWVPYSHSSLMQHNNPISFPYKRKGKYTSASPMGNLWVGFSRSFPMECGNLISFPYRGKASKIPIGMEYIWASHSHRFPIQNLAEA